MEILDKIKGKIRDIKDFPQPGIIFKDITPLLADPVLCRESVALLASHINGAAPQAVVGIESRGFLFGMLLAQHFSVPFIPVRKSGKLPYDKISHSYSLEYGEATIEMHTDAIRPGWNVLIHDDLLATGGTAAAAASLVSKMKGNVSGFSFLISLDFLPGKACLSSFGAPVHALINIDHEGNK